MDTVVSLCFAAGMLVICAQVELSDPLWQLTTIQDYHYWIEVTVDAIF